MTLPDGFATRLAPGVRVRNNGHTLIGGAPTRVNYLSVRAQGLMRDGTLVVSGSDSRELTEQLLQSGMAEPIVALLRPMSLRDVACVIPVRDRPKSLERLLARLGGDMDVIVVDDASIDAESIAAVTARHGAQLIRLQQNIGPAGARNAGLKQVHVPFVTFIDSDVVVSAMSIEWLLRHFRDPRVALVAPRIRGLQPGGSWISRYEFARSSLDMGRESSLVRPNSRVGWLPSAVVVGRVEALAEGFDTSMIVGEDVDLVWRLEADGWRVRYDAEVEAEHDHLTSLNEWLRRKAFYGAGATPLGERHGLKAAPAALTPISAATLGAVLAQRKWSAPVVAALSLVMTWRLSRALRGSEKGDQIAVELAALGFVSNLAQLMHLLLRHWWPVAAVVGLFSSRMRWALTVAAIADTVIEMRRLQPDLDPARFALALRLDDAAYGAGLWAGALRARSISGLLPRFSSGSTRF